MKKNKSTAPSRTQYRILGQICNPVHPFRAPNPISDFGQVLAVQVDVSFVLDQLLISSPIETVLAKRKADNWRFTVS